MILIVGDLHAKRSFIYDDKHKTKDRYLRLLSLLFNDLIKISIDNKVNKIIFTGDIFDTSEIIDSLVLDTVIDCFKKLNSESRSDITILCGNHDKIRFRSFEFTPLKIFIDLGIEIVTIPEEKEGIQFIPYGFNPEEQKYSDIVITHLANKLSSPFDKEAINPGIINGKIILNGHVHKHEVIRLKKNRIFINIGIPFPTRKGEEMWDNYTILINEGTGKIIKKPLNLYKIQYLTINSIKEFEQIKPSKKHRINSLYLSIPLNLPKTNNEIREDLVDKFDTIQIYRKKNIKKTKNSSPIKTPILNPTTLYRKALQVLDIHGIDKKDLFKDGMEIIRRVKDVGTESSDLL